MTRRRHSESRSTTRRQLARLCPLLLLPLALDAVAEEPDLTLDQPIYESVDGIDIGRVFVSPDERERLDATRHLPQDSTPVGASDGAPPVEAESVSPKGIGYIQAGGKAARVFRDGDFVTAPRSEAGIGSLPSGIIVRHEADEVATEAGDEP